MKFAEWKLRMHGVGRDSKALYKEYLESEYSDEWMYKRLPDGMRDQWVNANYSRRYMKGDK